MNDFYDELADEIGADDWLIPAHEISNRKLIKRTPRHNIYRADWFGEVLVYEPRKSSRSNNNTLGSSANSGTPSSLEAHRPIHQQLNLELVRELSSLTALASGQPTPTGSTTSDYESEQTDSAYSSVSSTPQYHTKSTSTEFEFSPERIFKELQQQQQQTTTVVNQELGSPKKNASCSVAPAPPVLLNRDSFGYTCSPTGLHSPHSWSDLNELRLIAHDNFMLFMGASLAHEACLGASEVHSANQQAASLVMQMNHPKAATVYNLLHKAKLELNSSPIDRFFASKRQQISLDAKFRVCQQVSNALAYLHDKNIVHGRLTSANVHVELNQRVKISLIDSDEQPVVLAEAATVRAGANFHLPALTYLSPELIRTITVVGGSNSTTAANRERGATSNNLCCAPGGGRRCAPGSSSAGAAASADDDDGGARVHFDLSRLTKEADVFSFGTLLFELFRESFPFAEQVQDISWLSKSDCLNSPLFANNPSSTTMTAIRSPFEVPMPSGHRPAHWNGDIKLSASELIYQIGAGNMAANNLGPANNHRDNRFPLRVRKLVEECWSSDPRARPTFKQLAAKF